MPDISHILNDIDAGDPVAASRLLPLVYDELRRLAAAKMTSERPDHTLDATALVHEAYMRLAGSRDFASRSAFFRAAGVAMRRVLVDHARKKNADKRGAGQRRVVLDDNLHITESPEHLLALDDALQRFAIEEPRKAELVVLRFFAGLTNTQAAETLGISAPTAERWWAFARVWLFSELTDSAPEESIQQ